MRAELVSGNGNLFVLLDAREAEPPSAAEATGWCAAARELGGRAADGLLVLLEGERAVRLVVWNADGSTAAACGNGLRCAGWLLLRETGAEEVVLEMETGLRCVHGEVREDGAESLVADLGEVTIESLSAELPLLDSERSAWRGDVGNPHCVFLVEDVESPDFEARGTALQDHPLFPGGVNVGYVAERGAAWRLRVFERGVGETAACGTGAAAAAAALHQALGVPFPIELELPGGRLTITRGADGRASVTGWVRHLGSLTRASASSPRI